MINLLPPELKETYRYGRRNRILSHWLVVAVLCLVGAVGLTAGGYLYLNHSIDNTNQQVAAGQRQLQQLNQAGVEKQVGDISDNLKLAEQVLSKEVLFSELLKRLSAVIPSNTILTGLSISQSQSSVDISADTTDYNAATQLQVNLADPSNQIFSNADIQTITCNGGSSTNASYPCSVDIRALFASNNPFLFINSKGNS
jgi:Tfp pilus assembly protein PilN